MLSLSSTGTTFHEDFVGSYQKPADREVAVRTKMIEAKFHEEKLKIQQKHDAAVQKVSVTVTECKGLIPILVKSSYSYHIVTSINNIALSFLL